jgi:hypothetical protein
MTDLMNEIRTRISVTSAVIYQVASGVQIVRCEWDLGKPISSGGDEPVRWSYVRRSSLGSWTSQ